ncbi:hypothetical protein TVAG_377480 [Trichomonas vaginalis G3]|uniref:Uncharacterized protein n=1 Tax=Trichomonas vaginalis (strain ATCC PRA-98 / G3) TaxID=412133 RepID=A2G390_TRIV3|nr:hypothetical protein TVAG_377480 [Trichomonas vaginalis G3]|eukprot:XP_001301299.1 hypothetical protein [Trichomonas vaginalis G3]
MDEPCDEDIITKIKESRRANIVVTVTPENSDTDEEPLNEEINTHIKGTEALRASLPIICEFDTLQNR